MTKKQTDQQQVDLADPLLPLRMSLEVALIEQELLIKQACQRALRVWLPHVRAAVLGGKAVTAAAGDPPAPDLGAIPMTAHWWAGGVDGELAPVVGAVFSTGATVAEPDIVGAELMPLQRMRDQYWEGVHNRIKTLPDEVFDALTKRLNSALDAGTSVPDMRGIVESVLSAAGLVGNVNAIARTEATAAYNAGQLGAWQYSAGLTGEKSDKVWIATRDTRTRPAHRHADQQRVDLFAMFEVGGFPMAFPGYPAAPAELVVLCRCSMIELLKGQPFPDVKRKSWAEVDEESKEATRSKAAKQPPAEKKPLLEEKPQVSAALAEKVGRFTSDTSGLGKLMAAVDSGYRESDVTELTEGASSLEVARIRYADGTVAVKKKANWGQTENEQLAGIVGQAIGAPVPPVLRTEFDEVVMGYVPGDVPAWSWKHLDADQIDAEMQVLGDTPAGQRLGLLDLLIANGDRHDGNVAVDEHSGELSGGFDHGQAFGNLKPGPPPWQFSQFGTRWLEEDPVTRKFRWADRNPLTAADVRWLRTRLDAIRPQFDELDRLRDWKFMVAQLDQLAAHAGGTTNLFAPGPVTAGAVFHLPGEHDQRSHGRRGMPELDLDEDGIPVGFDMSGLTGGGWEGDRSSHAELAQAAHRAGFDGVKYDGSVGSGHAAVDPKAPRMLLIAEKDRWSDEWFQRASNAPAPHGDSQTFWMPESRGSSQTGYLIDHESGHSVAFENGQHAAGYPRLKSTIVEVAAAQGIDVRPVDYEMAEGGGVKYVVKPNSTGRPLTENDFGSFMQLEVAQALAGMGMSWKCTQGPAEIYAELWAAWLGGNDTQVVQAVAEAEGWTR